MSQTLADVLMNYTEGPQDGLFSDGSASPNPGPGGWGVVWVEAGRIRDQRWGHSSEKTTNNRMEMRALIEAMRMVDPADPVVIWSDSQLCVNTLTQWAAGWKRNGWRRKKGPVEDLDLVKEAYQLFQERPRVELRWLRGHRGTLWNEYADSLATAWMRDEL